MLIASNRLDSKFRSVCCFILTIQAVLVVGRTTMSVSLSNSAMPSMTKEIVLFARGTQIKNRHGIVVNTFVLHDETIHIVLLNFKLIIASTITCFSKGYKHKTERKTRLNGLNHIVQSCPLFAEVRLRVVDGWISRRIFHCQGTCSASCAFSSRRRIRRQRWHQDVHHKSGPKDQWNG